MDGFEVKKQFLCKELGMVRVGEGVGRIGVQWNNLSAKDKTTCRYIMQKIHKLLFGVPRGVKSVSIYKLESIVSSFYSEVKQSESSVLAYKGGHYERDLLGNLDIPMINLENYGCPKVERLIGQLAWMETCGNHLTADAYLHCPKVEVEAMEWWIQDAIEKQ